MTEKLRMQSEIYREKDKWNQATHKAQGIITCYGPFHGSLGGFLEVILDSVFRREVPVLAAALPTSSLLSRECWSWSREVLEFSGNYILDINDL